MKKFAFMLMLLFGFTEYSDAAKFPLVLPQIYSFSGRFIYIFESCDPENREIPNETKRRIHVSLKGRSLPDLRCLTFDLVEDLSKRLTKLDEDKSNKDTQRAVMCALKTLRHQIPNPRDGFEIKIPRVCHTSFEWCKFKFKSLNELRRFKAECGNMRQELWRLIKDIEKISI